MNIRLSLSRLRTSLRAAVAAAVVAAAALVVMVSSCERRPLELYYDQKAEVKFTFDWQTRFHERPEGMTVMIANDRDSIILIDPVHDIDQYTVRLTPGHYRLLAMKWSFGEFGSMSFGERRSYKDIFAVANTVSQYTSQFWDTNVAYMREPETIGVAVDTFTVLDDWIERDLDFIDYRERIPSDTTRITLPETIYPMTTTLAIRVKVINIQYMSSVEGNISGMADGFQMASTLRRRQQGYHQLPSWRTTIDPDDRSIGWITTRVNTFGLPHDRELSAQRDSTSNVLSLCFTLIDGTKQVFRYNVGKLIRYVSENSAWAVTPTRTAQVAPEITLFEAQDLVLPIELLVDAPLRTNDEVPNLPYAQPTGTGAFDAVVEDWGDEETITIGF